MRVYVKKQKRRTQNEENTKQQRNCVLKDLANAL